MHIYNKNYKREILVSLLLLSGIYTVDAQTTTQNYVRTRIANKAIATNTKLDLLSTNKDSVQTTIQYVDGLGRSLQTVQRQASPTAKDIVQPFTYDQFGRESLKYLPYAPSTTADASYRTDALSTGAGVALFYNPSGNPATTVTQQSNGVPNTAFPLAQTAFEASPLNRVIEQGSAGTAWQLGTTPGAASNSHSVRVVITTNDQTTFGSGVTGNNGSRQVALYTAAINSNQSRTLGRSGNNATYSSNQLFVTITRNENWQPSDGCFNTTEEYKDKEGHLLLKRTYNIKVTGTTATPIKAAEMLSTYYVYDDLGNLCFVLPPGASPDAIAAITQVTLDYRCYQYRYDTRNRLVQKKIPGKGWEYTIYNKADQPVAAQDSVQRMKVPQEWTITKYDAMGRTVLTGIYQYGSTAGVDNHVAVQGFADVQSALWETPIGTGNGYTTNTWPATWATTLSLNYYDSYTGIPGLPGNYDLHTLSGYSKRTTGLLTASKTLVLNTTGDYLWSVPYYDDDGKVIKAFNQHYIGGASALNSYNYNVDTTAYNFLKLPTMVKRSHYLKNAGGTAGVLTLTATDYYSYDHMGRKLGTSHQMRDGNNASQATILLARSDYNEVGQLKLKRLHSINSGTNWLQSIDYRYNPRGWLTNINNAGLSNDGGLTSTDANDKFGEELSYDATTSVTKQYNGNVATVMWKSAPIVIGGTTITPVKQIYDYGYDHLNRLRSAVSTSSATAKDNLYGENLTYDNMGNITGLGRYDNISGKMQIDTLNYLYSDAYNSYRVNRIDDASTYTGASGFQDPVKVANEYTYDGNGNELKDLNKGISSITYNMLNLPQVITKAEGSTTATISYIYDSGGNKLRKIYVSGSGTTTTTEYDRGIEYDNSTSTVAFIQTDEGRARKSGAVYVYEYDLKDHLGNTRVTLTPEPTDVTQQTAKLLQENDYYPFGYTIQSLQMIVSPKNQYLYNHKELQEETGFYDYGARFYDPVIGKWNSVDPLAEKFFNGSPYSYVENNPVLLVDPDGKAAVGPGDEFATLDEAAHDFGKTYNGISITMGKEIATSFYKKEVDGKTVYSYSVPLVGEASTSGPSAYPKGTTRVAIGHLHANYVLATDDYFSGSKEAPMHNGRGGDVIIGALYRVDILYLGTPRGELLSYDMKTKTTNTLYKDLPSDPHDPTRVNRIPPSGELRPGANPEPPLDDPHHPSPPRPRPDPGQFPNRIPFINPPQIPPRDIPDRRGKRNPIIQ
jgi:RHS repeat-associated protein